MTFFGDQPAWLVQANVGLAIILVLIFGPLGLPGRIMFLHKARLPEAEWRHRYTRESIDRFADMVGERGIRRYRRALGWDVLFALLFGGSLAALIDALLARSLDSDQSLFRWTVWTPAVYAIFDLAEDFVLLSVTSGKNLTWAGETPNLRVGDGLVRVARTLTLLKFVFVGLSLVCVIAGAVSLALFGPEG